MKEFIEYVRNNITSCRNIHHNCYDIMESRGIAAMGCCSGKYTYSVEDDTLMNDCIDCPFYVDIREKEN